MYKRRSDLKLFFSDPDAFQPSSDVVDSSSPPLVKVGVLYLPSSCRSQSTHFQGGRPTNVTDKLLMLYVALDPVPPRELFAIRIRDNHSVLSVLQRLLP